MRFGKLRQRALSTAPTDKQSLSSTPTFFNELIATVRGAAGDAAQAYVIAHEVGHHIQTVSGISDQVPSAHSNARRRPKAMRCRSAWNCRPIATPASRAARAKNSAGQSVLEAGDMEEAMRAANAIGDDTLMRSAEPAPRARKLHARDERATHDPAAPRPAIGGPTPMRRIRYEY